MGIHLPGLYRCDDFSTMTALCWFCQKREGTRLCDGPARQKGHDTCDARMCPGCAKRTSPDHDLCPTCASPSQALNALAAWRAKESK